MPIVLLLWFARDVHAFSALLVFNQNYLSYYCFKESTMEDYRFLLQQRKHTFRMTVYEDSTVIQR